MDDTKSCAHRSCGCELPISSHDAHCSDHCRAASARLAHPENYGVPQAFGMSETPPPEACQCGHPECGENAPGADIQNAQSSTPTGQ